MFGSDNVWNVNQTKDLRDLKDVINPTESQVSCAGESSDFASWMQPRQRVCAACATPLMAVDRRVRYCSVACQRKTAAASLRRRQAEHRAKFPERVTARQALKNAILLGKVRRCTRCEECGAKGHTEGHHHDYAKPFYVTWLCRECHAGLDGGQHFGCGGHAERLTAHTPHTVGEA